MTVLHLHVGMHKTGTSAFQKACEVNYGLLAAHGFTYHRDDLDLGCNHSYFRRCLERGNPHDLERAIRTAFEANRRQNYIISGEDISYLDEANLKLLASIFREYFAEIRVYAVLRPPISYMHSATQEILKDPWATIDVLFSRWDVTPSYRRRFEKFMDEFGRVEFIAYGPDALSVLGGSMGLPAIEYPRENRSVSIWTSKMLAALKPFPSWAAAKSAAASLSMLDVSDTYNHAPVEIVHYWSEQVAQDREWLERVWSAPDGFFDEPPPTVPYSYYETFSREEVGILRHR